MGLNNEKYQLSKAAALMITHATCIHHTPVVSAGKIIGNFI